MRVLVCSAAAIVTAMCLGLATARAARSGATAAAAPFAQAWAAVPTTSAERRARNVVVFGAESDIIGGFNTVLNCCNANWNTWLGGAETSRGAFVQNDKGVWVKDLVTRASATKTSLSYTISPRAFWYWGGRKLPVTYRDFVYTLQQIDDPRNDIAGRAGYGNVDPTKFTHKGDRQVTFFWKTTNCSTDFPCGPYANWQSLFSGLYPAAALAGLDFNKIWTSCICGANGKPVSDGPFYLSNYTPGQGVTLRANPYFYKRPGVAEIDFKVITSTPSEAEAMQSGTVDAISPTFGPDLLPLERLSRLTFDQVPGYFVEFLWMREGKGSSNVLLRAPWMRQAIALAINRQSIIDHLFPGSGLKPLDNLLTYATEAGYKPDFARWNYNPQKALAILKTHCTGGPTHPTPGNNKIWQCSGFPATIDWTWPAESAARTTTEGIAKANLKSVGIALVERPLPYSTIFGQDGLASGNFDIANFGLYTTGNPGDFYDAYRCAGDLDWTGYCSHTLDALLDAANRELDPTKRATLYQQADADLAAAVPAIPLYQLPAPLIHKSDLLGMRANPGINGAFWNTEDWHWRQ